MKIRGRTAVILFGIVLLIVGFSSYGAFSETGNMEKLRQMGLMLLILKREP